MKGTTVGIDVAKSIFQRHGVDAHGKVALQKRVRAPSYGTRSRSSRRASLGGKRVAVHSIGRGSCSSSAIPSS